MYISEAKLRQIIRAEIKEAKAPKDPFGRAGKRFLDAVEKKGVDGALRATLLRVDRITDPEKADGVAKWMADYIKTAKLTPQEKKMAKMVIKNARAKS